MTVVTRRSDPGVAHVPTAGISPLFSLKIDGAALGAGEALDAGDACYIKQSDGRVYKANGTAANEAARFAGFTHTSYASGAGNVRLYGPGTMVYYGTTLTPGATLYLSTSAGRLDTSPTVGDPSGVARAISTTGIFVITQAESSFTAAIADEEAAREAADTTLQTNITAEATTRAAADTTLQTNITAETTARVAADTTEAATRAAADTAESSARAAADTTLTTNLSTETTNRTNADTTEASTRAAADTALTTRMDAVHEADGTFKDEVIDAAAVDAAAFTFPSLGTDIFNQSIPVGLSSERGDVAIWWPRNNTTLLATAEIVTNDTNNPYGGNTLRFLGTSPSTVLGKLIPCSKLGLKPGDTVMPAVRLSSSGGSWAISARCVKADLSFTTPGTVVTSGLIAATGSDQVLTATAPLTVEADSAYVLPFVSRSGTSTPNGDIYALWANKGTKAYDPLPGVDSSWFWQEVEDARADLPALGDRLTSMQTSEVGRDLLMDWWAGIAKLRNSVASTQVNVALVGDSWYLRADIRGLLIDWMQTEFGDAGPGWISANFGGSNPTNWTFTRTGTWTVSDANTDATVRGPDFAQAFTTDLATPAKITIVAEVNSLVLHYESVPGGGDIAVWIDGSLHSTVTTDGSGGYDTHTIGGLSTASHTIELRVAVAGSQGIKLYGVDARKSANGVRVHRLAVGGLTVHEVVAVNAATWQTGFAALVPNLAIIQYGANDRVAGATPAAYTADLIELIDRIRTARPRCDVLVVAPADTGTGGTYDMSEYAAAARTISATVERVAFFDGYRIMSPWADGDARGLYQDTLHLNTEGGRVQAQGLIHMLREE